MYTQVHTYMIYRVTPWDLSSLTHKVRRFIHTNLMPNISPWLGGWLNLQCWFFSLVMLLIFGRALLWLWGYQDRVLLYIEVPLLVLLTTFGQETPGKFPITMLFCYNHLVVTIFACGIVSGTSTVPPIFLLLKYECVYMLAMYWSWS